MRTSNNERLQYAFIGSIFMVGAGVYNLFLQSAFLVVVPLILGSLMLLGSFLMLKEEKEKVGGIIILLSCIILLSIYQTWIGSIISNEYLDLGSERLNFGIIERVIQTGLSVTGVSLGLVGGVDGMAGKDFFLKQLERLKVVHITCILNALFLTFGLGWVTFYVIIARNFWESLQFLPIFGVLLAAFFIGWWAINRRKAIWVIVLGQTVCAFVYGFLTLVNFMYMPIVVLNILSNGAIISTTGPDRFFNPRWMIKRNRIHNVAAPIIFVIVTGLAVVPYVYPWSSTPVQITVPSDEAPNFEINWAYGSEMAGQSDWDWIVRPNILSMLNTTNDIDGINVSITVALIREVFEEPLSPIVLDILNQTIASGINVYLMPVPDASLVNDLLNETGHSDTYVYDDNIDVIRDIYIEMVDWLYNASINGYDQVTEYEAFILDLERSGNPDINQLVMDYLAGANKHIEGSNELADFIDEVRSGMLDGQPNKIKPDGDRVAAAFFGFHAHDFMDFDDAQQDFFQISIYPPENWEYIAAMVYQTGTGSTLSTLGYCNQMNYHFGDRGVMYAYTAKSDVQTLYEKFKIAKNTGFPFAGAWAIHELFSNGSNFINGYDGVTPKYMSAHDPEPWNETMFIELHQMLADTTGEPVTFEFDGWNDENAYELLTLMLDIWLARRWVYFSTPFIGEWLPNNNFMIGWTMAIIVHIVILVFIIYIAWNPFHRETNKDAREKAKSAPSLPKKSNNGDFYERTES